jgi:uncharacterized protein YecE (DUF72 family)
MAVHRGRHDRLRLRTPPWRREALLSGYSDAALQRWERKIRAWAHGDTPVDARLRAPRHSRRESPRDIVVYFDNDAKVRAPFDAMSLAHRLSLGSPLSRASALGLFG